MNDPEKKDDEQPRPERFTETDMDAFDFDSEDESAADGDVKPPRVKSSESLEGNSRNQG